MSQLKKITIRIFPWYGEVKRLLQKRNSCRRAAKCKACPPYHGKVSRIVMKNKVHHLREALEVFQIPPSLTKIKHKGALGNIQICF